MINPYLVGPRLYARPVEISDAPVLQGWVNDPDVRRTTMRHRPMSLKGEEAFLESLRDDEKTHLLMLTLKADDRPIGVACWFQIDQRNRSAEYGLTIGAKDCWNQGYGGEATRLMIDYAFGRLNLHRVWLRAIASNAHAVRLYRKAGFRDEGLLRDDYFDEGRYWDSHVMGLLAPEWVRGEKT